VVDSSASELEIYVNAINIVTNTFTVIIQFSVRYITIAEYLVP